MNNKIIRFVRRATTPFLESIPTQVEHFDGYIYAVVKRKHGKDLPGVKWGTDARLDPCEFDWVSKTITINIPLNINVGIESEDDLDPMFFESIEASFLALIHGCLP